MKHLFKIAETDQSLSPDCWTLQEVLEIIREASGDMPFHDIYLWTKTVMDDKGKSITELHFGIDDEISEPPIEGVEIDSNPV